MKIIDIANRIDKSERNEDWIDITSLAQDEFNISLYDYPQQSRLKCYWVSKWCCTDTYVGIRIYFLDDKAVGISKQDARKSDEYINWFSKEAAIKVRDFILTLFCEKEEEEEFNLCDINEDIGDNYTINFNNSIIHRHKATYNNEPIEILERIRETPDWGIDTMLKVKLPSGEITEVNIKELRFKFNLNEI